MPRDNVPNGGGCVAQGIDCPVQLHAGNAEYDFHALAPQLLDKGLPAGGHHFVLCSAGLATARGCVMALGAKYSSRP